jgi:hypothetical protein
MQGQVPVRIAVIGRYVNIPGIVPGVLGCRRSPPVDDSCQKTGSHFIHLAINDVRVRVIIDARS